MRTGRTITLEEKGDGWWTATDQESGAVSQGQTRGDALEHLDQAIALVNDDGAAPDAAPVPDSVWFDE